MTTLERALELGKIDRIEEWVHAFLNRAHPYGNIDLYKGLKCQTRYWIGPIMIDLSKLIQKGGPDKNFKFVEDSTVWDSRINKNIERLRSGEKPPPLIIEYKNQQLYIADGNHRYKALVEEKYSKYWVVIWFNSKEDYNEYIK